MKVIFKTLALIAALSLRMSFAYAADTVPVSFADGIRLVDVIRMAVEKNSTVRIYKSQERIAAANEMTARSQFDPQLKLSAARSSEYSPISEGQKKLYRLAGSPDVTKLKQSAFTYNLGYERRLRNGISISPSLSVSTSESNNPQSPVPLTSGKVQFALIKPLARGSGPDAVTVNEKTSAVESEGAFYDTLYAISQTVRSAVSSYWTYAYYFKAKKIAEQSMARSEKLYNDTKLLVDNSEVPPAELDQLMASLIQKRAECEKASQSLLQARNDLRVAIGVPDDPDHAIGPPLDFFPAERIASGTLEIESFVKRMTDIALERRNDYKAAVRRLDSFKYSLPAARDALRPQVDLQFAAGYNGRKDDKGAAAMVSSLYDNVPGTNVSATVSYSFAPDKRAASADLARQQEQLGQSRIRIEEMVRQIRINIATRANAVASVMSRYRLMIESGRLYDKALANEKEKNRMGVSTLMDVVNLEDRLGQAELGLESAVLEYASAVTELRFEAGCLGRLGTSECEVTVDDLIELPVSGPAGMKR